MSKKSQRPKQKFSQSLILLGVIVLVGVVLFLKMQKSDDTSTRAPGGLSPEILLSNALEEGHPAFGFFHSDNCESCVQMMGIVAQVFPEYSEKVVLVDVNVYDPSNASLLRQAQIRAIPTMIFFNQRGEKQTVLGVMRPDQLHAQLNAIIGE